MNAHAFIFSSLADRPAAARLAASLHTAGWLCTVALDAAEDPGPLAAHEILTDFPRHGRLNGARCVTGILRTMASSEAPVRVKLDADMRLTTAGLQWLSHATHRPLGFALQKSQWLGAWAIPATLLHAAITASTGPGICRTCGESKITGFIFRRLAKPLSAHGAVQVWRAGRPIHPTAWLITLPSFLPPEVRAHDLEELAALPLHYQPSTLNHQPLPSLTQAPR